MAGAAALCLLYPVCRWGRAGGAGAGRPAFDMPARLAPVAMLACPYRGCLGLSSLFAHSLM